MVESKVIVNESQTETGSKLTNLLSWFKPFSRGIGMYAWLFQRLTGLFVVMYVFIHLGILATMLLDSFLGFETPGLIYNSITELMGTPLIEIEGLGNLNHAFSFAYIVDLGLLGALVYHGYNGIRVILFDLGIGIRHQKAIWWIFVLLGIISWILAMLIILQMPAIVHSGG